MKLFILFILLSLIAAILPFTVFFNKNQINTTTPNWPSHYQGKSLQVLGLSEKEQGFLTGFPGKIERFTDGKREIIIRYVTAPTRKLHPASDCLQAVGYNIKPLPIEINKNNIKMGCFKAYNNQQELKVCEYIQDIKNNTWSDVSAWYWNALWNKTEKPWVSYTIAESF